MFKKQAGGTQLLDSRKILEDEVNLGYGDKIGDLGCGPKAYFTFQAARIVGEKGLVYAADILKEVLSSVESHAKTQGFNNIQTVWTNLESYGATKIPESSLDISMLINVLFQAKDIAQMIKEAIRLTKPGGKLLVVDWKNIGAPLGPDSSRRVDVAKIKEYAEAYGLKLEKEFTAGQYHFALIFIK
ncbi:methyltransferase domain-containing protein [bacterium]|nr:methyltransferase domain-containing protein [bacterium]